MIQVRYEKYVVENEDLLKKINQLITKGMITSHINIMMKKIILKERVINDKV